MYTQEKSQLWNLHEQTLKDLADEKRERDRITKQLLHTTQERATQELAWKQQESTLHDEVSSLQIDLRKQKWELASATAQRETAFLELDAARKLLAESEKRIAAMSRRVQEQHQQIVWLDDSLLKEKCLSAASPKAQRHACSIVPQCEPANITDEYADNPSTSRWN